MSTRYDAIVIGGGVAGASCAILLARLGWSVALIEKRAFPRRKVCGECIAAPNLDVLDALGVGEAFAARAGPPLERVAFYSGEHTITAELPRVKDAAQPWGRALSRDRLDALLVERARALGAALWQPWSAVDLARKGGVHECTLEPAEGTAGPGARVVLEAAVVIDAHGSWEPGPAAAQRARAEPRASDLFAFKANFTGARLEPGLLPVLAFDGGYGGMVIADDGKLTIACCVRRDRLREWRTEIPGVAAGLAVEALLGASCAGVRRALDGAERADAWLTVGPIRPGVRALWDEQRGFAVGNAAGEAHPILGEGISMALQGAWLLCARLDQHAEALLAGGSQVAAARAYERDWRLELGGKIRWAALFAHAAMRPAARAAVLPLLSRWPGLLEVAARLGGKTRRARSRVTAQAQAPALRARPGVRAVEAGTHAKVDQLR